MAPDPNQLRKRVGGGVVGATASVSLVLEPSAARTIDNHDYGDEDDYTENPIHAIISSSSTETLKDVDSNTCQLMANNTKKSRSTLSLKDRSKIPPSLYVTILCACGLKDSGVWRFQSLISWKNSMVMSMETTVYGSADYTLTVWKSLMSAQFLAWHEYLTFSVVAFCVLSLVIVFFVAPFRAGVWTGQRASRHRIHRFMGLAFMIQYAMAWVEFLTNYETAAIISHLPFFIAMNGLVQAYSAYFSFKVLPDLEDAGYFSDRAVMSRSFIHENIYFQLLCLWGSVFYHPGLRAALKAHPIGLITEHVFVFFPYILVRPWFPITRFKDAGTTYKSRSKKNEKFYEIGTTMVKIFYLWAKYFLGFFMNFLIHLELLSSANEKIIKGMFLLNIGTVSLAMFLHTLRFKKILPPKFTFTLYLMQIYATFSAVPTVVNMFQAHPNLCALCMAGLFCNMTRDRRIHAVWCVVSCILITRFDINW